MQRICSPLGLGVLFSGLLVIATPSVHAVDFLRGDANSDGEVTFSDAHRIMRFVFTGRAPLECLDAGDMNDSGELEISDVVELLSFVALSGSPPAQPFPELGADTTEDDLGCRSYGNGARLVDDTAALKILTSPAAGGEDPGAKVHIMVTNSNAIAGFHGKLRDIDGVVQHVNAPWSEDMPLTTDPFFRFTDLKDGVLEFSLMVSSINSRNDTLIPAGEDVTVLDLPICLAVGTPAGEFPLTLEFGELVDYDSGSAIQPELVSGSLIVAEEITATSDGCVRPSKEPRPPEDQGGCPQKEPREIVDAEEPVPVEVRYELDNGSASAGEAVSLTFSMRSSMFVQGFAFSLDFDEEVLEVTAVEKVWERPDGKAFFFETFDFNNDNQTPGNSGVDEGFILGAILFDVFCDTFDIPPGEDVPVVRLDFVVKPGAEAGETEVRFLDGAPNGGWGGVPVANTVTIDSQSVSPELSKSFVFINGFLNIVPDVTTFNKFGRGDANGDKLVDVTDAVFTLHYQFANGVAPPCADAADSNDDGHLNISDPIATLTSLFHGGQLPPPSLEAPGEDPTPDELDCRRGTHD